MWSDILATSSATVEPSFSCNSNGGRSYLKLDVVARVGQQQWTSFCSASSETSEFMKSISNGHKCWRGNTCSGDLVRESFDYLCELDRIRPDQLWHPVQEFARQSLRIGFSLAWPNPFTTRPVLSLSPCSRAVSWSELRCADSSSGVGFLDLTK